MNQKPRKPSLRAVNENPSKEEPKKELQNLEDKLKDLQDKLTDSIKLFSATRANTMKIVFDSYIKAGFSESHAMELLKKAMELEAFTTQKQLHKSPRSDKAYTWRKNK